MGSTRLENVSHSYGREPALQDVNLTFADDVTTAVVGPSGSGKSTLVQTINGLVRPERGTISVFGKPIDYQRLPELRRQIGYSVQGTGLFPHLTVWRNITLLAWLEGWEAERIRARGEQLMALTGLALHYRDRHPHELSGGEQQRVGLCRAMMLNPRLFLLDEPFGALDPVTRREMHGEFLRLQAAEPRTILLVTHDLREAVRLAQTLVILERGRVAQHGSRDEILNRPANAFVRRFFQTQLEE